MREIKLPSFNTISFTLDPQEYNPGGIIMPDGYQHIPMGSINSEGIEELNIARLNGSTILWATVCLEQKLERVIVNYFLGPFQGPCHKRHLFENEVVKASSFQFNFKKQLIHKISEQISALSGKERSKLQGNLKFVMLWRNAFAHGNLKLDSKKGVVLSYYSSSHKEQHLDEEFWKTVENRYNETDALINKLETASTKDG